MASIIELGPAWHLATMASAAHSRGDLVKAEKLQRLLVEHAKQKWGVHHIVTAAASFDLVRLLEEQEKNEEAHALRLQIRRTLNLTQGCPRHVQGNISHAAS